MMNISIHAEQPEVKKNRSILQKIANWSCEKLKLPASSLTVIVTNDEHLKGYHKKYLNDDSYTDVMTFNLGDEEVIEGEIYISL